MLYLCLYNVVIQCTCTNDTVHMYVYIIQYNTVPMYVILKSLLLFMFIQGEKRLLAESEAGERTPPVFIHVESRPLGNHAGARPITDLKITNYIQ